MRADAPLAGGIAAGLAVLLRPAAVLAAGGGLAALPSLSVNFGTAQTTGQVATSVQILLALTVLSMAPAVLLLMTSFTRIVVVLSFARSALGTTTLPPNQILVGLALFLTFFVMNPTLQQIYHAAWVPYQAGQLDLTAALRAAEKPLAGFMQRQTRPADIALFEGLQRRESTLASGAGSSTAAVPAVPTASTGTASAGTAGTAPGAVPFTVLVPAFVISELRTAFEMGFLLYVPFMVIDLVVSSTLMAMGMFMLPPMLISLPFKILLFVLVDGWALLVQSLVLSFH